MAKPKSLLERIGEAIGVDKKDETPVVSTPLPDRVEEQVSRIEEAAAPVVEASPAFTYVAPAGLVGGGVSEPVSEPVVDAEAETRAEIAQMKRQMKEQELALRRQEYELEEAKRLAAAAAEAAALRAAAEVRTYTVQPGDSLSAISLAVYGTYARWPEIFEANRDQISDPNLIQIGQVLRIP